MRRHLIFAPILIVGLLAGCLLLTGAQAQTCPITTTQPPLVDTSLCNALSTSNPGPNISRESIATRIIRGDNHVDSFTASYCDGDHTSVTAGIDDS
jgi:hypothetical protein